MLWYNLRLHSRILAGYGLMFVLVTTLVLFLMIRFTSLNAQISDLSTEVAAEAEAGSQLSAQVALTQQLVDRYLQQPDTANQQTATDALKRLSSQIHDVKSTLDSQQQRDQLTLLETTLTTYQQSFSDLSLQISAQKQTSGLLIARLSDATLNIQKATTSYLSTAPTDPSLLSLPQQHLELAILLSARLVNEQNATLGNQATSELSVARSSLLFQQRAFDETTNQLVLGAIENMQQAKEGIAKYQQALAQFQEQRNTLLNDHGTQMQDQATKIANSAMDHLIDTSHELERQSGLVQQWMLAGLVLILVITGIFGGIFPRTITRPLLKLVEATRKIHQGDFDVALDTTDGSEIGQLTNAFSQMTLALRQERQAVQDQQAALAKQNQELEQTLGELQASTAAREQLTQTVQMLSVPVVPILKQVILIPLVGEIDGARANILLERLLSHITSERARTAIIDITGVPVVDTSLVEWLIKINLAAQLMGARCILVGVSPEVAQALVASGINVDQLHVRADLRTAVEDAIRLNRRVALHLSHS